MALSSQDSSEAEKHMGAWLATVISWLHTTALKDPDAPSCNSSRQAHCLLVLQSRRTARVTLDMLFFAPQQGARRGLKALRMR